MSNILVSICNVYQQPTTAIFKKPTSNSELPEIVCSKLVGIGLATFGCRGSFLLFVLVDLVFRWGLGGGSVRVNVTVLTMIQEFRYRAVV